MVGVRYLILAMMLSYRGGGGAIRPQHASAGGVSQRPSLIEFASVTSRSTRNVDRPGGV
jgi:hypothetical protein